LVTTGAFVTAFVNGPKATTKTMSHLPIPDLTPLFKMAAWALCISIPLALWKLVDIAIWLWAHVHIAIG
jgi:hypothetical protein